MQNKKLRLCLWLTITLALASCDSENYYLTKGRISADLEIDTLEKLPNKNIYILNMISNSALGDFTSQLAIAKKINKDSNLVYFLSQNQNEAVRISAKYIAYVKLPGYQNWGWFGIKDGKILDKLPGVDAIADSLKSDNKEKTTVWQKNGYFTIIRNGRRQNLDYGNFVTKYKNRNFQNTAFKLYRLVGDELKVVSNDGDSLFNQENGIYFLPPPGYGVNRFFCKQELLNAIDSASKLSKTPDQINIVAQKNGKSP